MRRKNKGGWVLLGLIMFFLLSLSISWGQEIKKEGLERQVADRCEVCGGALARNVNICLTSSSSSEACVDQAIAGYFNCARNEQDGCAETKGRKLYDCIQECEDLKCVKECIK